MPILGRKPQVNPFRKVSIVGLFEVLVFIAQKDRFFVLGYRKRHFPGLYCLKRKVGKIAIFGPKPWVNPFGKVSLFGLFEVPFFKAQKGVFLFQNIVKDFSLAYIASKEKLEKLPFLDKNHGLTFGKISIDHSRNTITYHNALCLSPQNFA